MFSFRKKWERFRKYFIQNTYSSHQVQPCTKKMKKVKKTFMKKTYWEKKEKFTSQENFFLPEKTFYSSFVIDAIDRQLIKTIKLNYICRLFVVF